ncbi:LCP family glycopolymer transferase [Nonomuraea muscovyensis]|uniref:LCP family protein required for cell wall assembly n=1 Tax=Nonomuraea muscovyensis TaxID=1124761 RepID=A0A7X0CD69_9ACTN|nr:LCP family protein [Nonomuraea muscovyensis]MBB6352050.1 LCP family protein required for cell wall assembly [Nonomuraea muscovyensis]
MSKRDGVDTGGRKRRPARRPRPTSGGEPGSGARGSAASGGPASADAGRVPSADPGKARPADTSPSAGAAGTSPGGAGRQKPPGRAEGKGPGRAPGRAPAGAPRFAKPLNAGSVLGWTALSAIVPGAAHLRAGHRRTGLALLGVYAVLLIAALAFGLTRNDENLGAFAGNGMMVTMVVLLSVGALCWFALLVTSYVALNPSRLDQQGQIVSGILVGVLCVAVMSPFALGANAVLTVRDTFRTIFPSVSTEPGVAPIKEEDPWNGRKRVNFLLLGGDAAGNRTGVRTDSMNVASVDIETGNTVLFSLPRNLQHVRFPPSSPLHKQFPNGYMAELGQGGLLNEVWQYANDHPQIMGGKNKGARALMDAIGHTLGIKIDYYALMNMYGFADLVDAIGGLRIRVEQDVRWGGLYGTAGTIKAGTRMLSGEQALWYGRSRVGSDDFSRMGRQRCVIGAFAKQATPDKILLNFSKIASATKRLAQTNIPQQLVEPLVGLALKVKKAKITSMQFVPPEFWPGSPDWVKIRRAAAKAIADSTRPPRRAAAAAASPTASTAPSTSAAAKPTQTPTRNNQKSAQSLEELCGF